MPGLIPLRLKAVATGNRTSLVFSPPPSPQTPLQSHARNSSTGSLPEPFSPRRKPTQRLSQPAPSSLSVMPYTAAEWRRTVAEVKRQHQHRRYRACFARCTDVLDNVKDTSNVEPTYLIYLHFYAASSMETCARPMLATSLYRDRLLRQARTHYNRAATLIEQAGDSVTLRTRSSSASSTTSSIHSPEGSVSSGAWASETDISSPTPSVCSFDDLSASFGPAQSPATPAKKKVSFSLPQQPPRLEPFIRPDSPTLGFEDEYFTAALARAELPAPPKRPQTPESDEAEAEEEENTTPRALAQQPNPLEEEHDHLNYMLADSVHRYCETLAGLKFQITSHTASLDGLLDRRAKEDEALRERCLTPAGDEMRNLERRARIERLRQSGWQRKRFDARRYEELCDSVMAELT